MRTRKKHILIILAVLSAIALIILIYWNIDPSAYEWMPKCPFYKLTGYKCPGCGTQRALHALLHGNFVDGITYNPILLPALLYIIVLECLRFTRFRDVLSGTIATRTILIIVCLYWLTRNIFNF